MKNPERLLRLVIRYLGTVTLLAIPAVFMPYEWMNAIHARIGLGALPEDPIVGYLARSLSAFYAMFGGLLWAISFDVRRHQQVLAYLAVAMIAFGVILFGVDLVERMPRFWIASEAPIVIGWGTVMLWLNRKVARAAASPVPPA